MEGAGGIGTEQVDGAYVRQLGGLAGDGGNIGGNFVYHRLIITDLILSFPGAAGLLSLSGFHRNYIDDKRSLGIYITINCSL